MLPEDLLAPLLAEEQRIEAEIGRLAQQLTAARDRTAQMATALTAYSREPTVWRLQLLLARDSAREWSVNEILAGLYADGWTTTSDNPAAVIRSAVRVGILAGWAVRPARGRYRFCSGSTS